MTENESYVFVFFFFQKIALFIIEHKDISWNGIAVKYIAMCASWKWRIPNVIYLGVNLEDFSTSWPKSLPLYLTLDMIWANITARLQ